MTRKGGSVGGVMLKETLIALAMQCSPQVHPDTVMSVAKTESDLNPYAIAEIIPKDDSKGSVNRVKSYLPKSKEEALGIIRDIRARKNRLSVGLMQITSSNFSTLKTTANEQLNPCENLKAFQIILKDCYERGGDLKNALSCYYSGNFLTGKIKEKQFSDSSYIERIGYSDKSYVVPSTKEDIEKEKTGSKAVKSKKQPDEITIVYPSYVMRGIASIKEPSNATN